MARYCSDCEFLNPKKEKPPGCYFCKKQKKNVWANTPACDKYEFNYSRKQKERLELYDKARKEKHVDRHPMSATELFFFFLMAFILWLISIFAK